MPLPPQNALPVQEEGFHAKLDHEDAAASVAIEEEAHAVERNQEAGGPNAKAKEEGRASAGNQKASRPKGKAKAKAKAKVQKVQAMVDEVLAMFGERSWEEIRAEALQDAERLQAEIDAAVAQQDELEEGGNEVKNELEAASRLVEEAMQKEEAVLQSVKQAKYNHLMAQKKVASATAASREAKATVDSLVAFVEARSEHDAFLTEAKAATAAAELALKEAKTREREVTEARSKALHDFREQVTREDKNKLDELRKDRQAASRDAFAVKAECDALSKEMAQRQAARKLERAEMWHEVVHGCRKRGRSKMLALTTPEAANGEEAPTKVARTAEQMEHGEAAASEEAAQGKEDALAQEVAEGNE